MKFTVVAASLAVGASALPSAAPAKFALQVSAAGKTFFLPKGVSGAGVADIKDAESCSINDQTQLVCGGKTIGVAASMASLTDMSQIKPVTSPASDITKGFSVDANNVLHWGGADVLRIPALKKAIDDKSGIYKDGEAKIGLFQPDLKAESYQLYFQLGCPGADGTLNGPGTHYLPGMESMMPKGLHNPVTPGTNKVIPL